MDPQLQQMLNQLREAHSPPGVGWWPLAPGWWVLGVLLLGVVIALAFLVRHRKKLGAYKKDALKILEQAHQTLQANADSSHFLNICSQVLRRLLLYRLGRTEVSHLTGDQWRELLQQMPGQQLSNSSLDALVVQQYRRHPEFDSESLYQDLRHYISSLEPAARV